jgi:hypothetical protein
MYILKKISENKLELFVNKCEDDFLKYIPAAWQTTEADIEVYLLPCSCHNHFDANRVLRPVENSGVVSLEIYESETIDVTNPEAPVHVSYNNLLKTCSTQLVSWPYDVDFNFTPPEPYIEPAE